MPILAVDGTELYYESHGSGPAVVFAHGVGGNHAIWFNQIAWFAKDHRVITFDHRGFGNSTDPEQKGRSACTDDLVALLDHLEVGPCVLVGQSMGGGTCVGFTKLFPQRVRALVLADTLHGLELPAGVESIMQRARAAAAGLGQIERVLGVRTRQTEPAKAELYRQINSFNATNRHNVTGTYPYMLTPVGLGALGLPVLFIAGEDDVLFPVPAIKAVQKQVVGSEWIEVIGAGHSAFYEQPERFNYGVADFIQRRAVS